MSYQNHCHTVLITEKYDGIVSINEMISIFYISFHHHHHFAFFCDGKIKYL